MSNASNFIIIGAMKGGTTSLYRYLASHPEVSVSRRKETNFFLGRRDYEQGLNFYFSQFDRRATAVGEASTNYTKRHLWAGVPERIAKALPEARLIYIVRDPIERTVSNYVHNYSHGRETRPFSEVLRSKPSYVKTSMYAYQLDAFLEYFPRDNILVVDSDALRNRTSSVLRDVFEFVGVAPDYEVPSINERFNVSKYKKRPSALARHVENDALRRVLRPLLPDRLTEPQLFKPPKLSTEDSKRLAEVLQPDAERFRAITGMTFEHWAV